MAERSFVEEVKKLRAWLPARYSVGKAFLP
jgi:hypothetical protein